MTTTNTRSDTLAGPVDIDRFGEYRRPTNPTRRQEFRDRITADGSGGFAAKPGRYHLYGAWSCPWSQRVALEIEANGLTDVIGISHVDDARDGRGWAFRDTEGPDPVNGFTLLSQAYAATEPGFDGHAGVPALWDRKTDRLVSNDPRLLAIDVATAFTAYRTTGVDTYPSAHVDEIEALDVWTGHAVNTGLGPAGEAGETGDRARSVLHAAFDRLEDELGDSPGERRFLVAETLTEADIRLWPSLARYAARAEAGRSRLGPTLAHWPRLARYAARLADLPAFRQTTRWSALGGSGSRPRSLTVGAHAPAEGGAA